MYIYTCCQWLLFFFFYCFFGWCFESAYVSLCQRRLVNRGFMRGPYLPIYGSGAIGILFAVLKVQENLFLVFLLGMLAATLLEYVTGAVMERLFQVRYWDYSNHKLNIHGYICLTSSLAWGGLSVVLVKIHHYVEEAVLAFTAHSALSAVITCLIAAVMLSDFIISFRNAIQIRELLSALDKVKEELRQWQEKLDSAKERMAEAVQSVETERLRTHQERLHRDLEEISKGLEEFELRRRELKERINFFKLDLIRNNPSAKSMQFTGAFEELREAVEQRIVRKKQRHAERRAAKKKHKKNDSI